MELRKKELALLVHFFQTLLIMSLITGVGMNLLVAPRNVELKIIKIRPIKDAGQRKQLSNLGFVVDAMVKVISESQGSLIVVVKGSRIALGEELASRIQVVNI